MIRNPHAFAGASGNRLKKYPSEVHEVIGRRKATPKVAAANELVAANADNLLSLCPCRGLAKIKKAYHKSIILGVVLGRERKGAYNMANSYDREAVCAVVYSEDACEMLLANLGPDELWAWECPLKPHEREGLLLPQSCLDILARTRGTVTVEDDASFKFEHVPVLHLLDAPSYPFPIRCLVNKQLIEAGTASACWVPFIIDMLLQSGDQQPANFTSNDMRTEVLEALQELFNKSLPELLQYQADKMDAANAQRFLGVLRSAAALGKIPELQHWAQQADSAATSSGTSGSQQLEDEVSSPSATSSSNSGPQQLLDEVSSSPGASSSSSASGSQHMLRDVIALPGVAQVPTTNPGSSRKPHSSAAGAGSSSSSAGPGPMLGAAAGLLALHDPLVLLTDTACAVAAAEVEEAADLMEVDGSSWWAGVSSTPVELQYMLHVKIGPNAISLLTGTL